MTAAIFKQVMKLPDASQFQKDSSCMGIAQFVGGIVKFQLTFHQLSYFGDDRKVSSTAGKKLPEELANLSTTELGERLHGKIKDAARTFCDSWQLLHRATTKDLLYIEQQLELRQAAGKKEPLDEAKLKKRLRFDELENAVEAITKDSGPLIKEAELYLQNVYRTNKIESDVRALLCDIDKTEGQLSEKKRILREKLQEKSKLQGECAGLVKQKELVEEGKTGAKQTMQYLENELKAVEGRLCDATRDEKNYTWWMFGSSSYVWQNDVALAKQKVSRFGEQKAKLEKDIADMKSGAAEPVKLLNDKLTQITTKHTTTQEQLKAMDADLKKECEEAEELEKKVAEEKKKVEDLVQGEGKKSVKHLLLARQALNDFAHSATAGADTAGSVWQDWSSELLAITGYFEEIMDAETLQMQQKAVWKIKQILGRNKIPLLSMIQQAKRFSLTPGAEDFNRYNTLPSRFSCSVEDIMKESHGPHAVLDVQEVD